MADELSPFDKISIPGAVLAAIIHRCSSSSGDSDGLLFGRAVPLPPLEPTDDLAPSPSPSLAAVVTSHLASSSPASFFDPLGRIDPNSPFLRSSPVPGSHLIGWFSARRRSPLRPSMRERAVSLSLFKSAVQVSADSNAKPSVFLLLSSSESGNLAVHAHDYRAFVICPSGALETRSVSIVNVGPAFRGQYGAFTPESALPWIALAPRGKDDGDDEEERRSLNGLCQVAYEQQLLDASAEGFGIERLGRLVGDGAAEYTSEVEDLYKKMLVKLEGLARQVEESNARVLEQESRNLELRKKLAGLD